MELIPVISAIISVVTFLLVVISFIVYKVRVKRRKNHFYPEQLKDQGESKPSKEFEGTQQFIKASDYRPYSQSKQTNTSEPNKPKENFSRNHFDKHGTKPRYLKYTSDGYITPEEDKMEGNLKWR
jgi:hypothetical protein